jgi:two-component system, OmpR family, response regulator
VRILLIEDDDKIASFIIKGLKQAGFAVDHAADGESGLHLAITEPYDAGIIDIMLPKMDGLVIIEEIRRQSIEFPVIILSARRSVDDRVKGLHAGSDDYLVKPFAFAELLARVQALIRRTSPPTLPTCLIVDTLRLDLLTREVFRGDSKILMA